MNRTSSGRFTFDKSDAERLADRVSKLLTHPGYSRARAERQAADELQLAHLLEDDCETDRAMGDDL